jgi:hypothetical protein
MAGVDLRTVQELMGHRTTTTTMRYAHLAPAHQAEAVERLVTAQAGVSQLAVVYCELIRQESNWVISESVTRVGLSYPRGVLRCHRSSPRVLTNACCVRVCWEST